MEMDGVTEVETGKDRKDISLQCSDEHLESDQQNVDAER
jgi:hypothetical protein